MSRILPTLLLLAATPFALAQEAPPPKAQQPGQVISIDFPGGTLRQLIDAMRRIDGRLNITAASLADEVELPPLSVKGASVENLLTAAAAIAPQDFAVACHTQAGAGEPIYTVIVQDRQRAGQVSNQAARERLVQVFSLRRLIEPQPGDQPTDRVAMPVETLLSALESGTQLGGGKPADLKYHRDAQLLFVVGTNDQVRLVQSVLQGVQQDQLERRSQLEMERNRAAAERQRAEVRQQEAGRPGKVDK